jgi:hypothetical protein
LTKNQAGTVAHWLGIQVITDGGMDREITDFMGDRQGFAGYRQLGAREAMAWSRC